MSRIFILFFIIIAPTIVSSNQLQNIDQIHQKEQRLEQERIKSIEEIRKDPNLSLQPYESENIADKIIENESPCLIIDNIALEPKIGEFEAYLLDTLILAGFSKGKCIGDKSISIILNLLNNEIIKQGYITTNVKFSGIDVENNTIKLMLNLGRINEISINNTSNLKNKLSLFSAFGENKSQEILNLRDIEQALENINSVSLYTPKIYLKPATKENFTDIYIDKKELPPITFQISVDNSGSNETGKYQGDASMIFSNILGFNETLFVSQSKNISQAEKTSSLSNQDFKRGKTYNGYYSLAIPFGYFLLEYSENRYTYNQPLAGNIRTYMYSGKNTSRNFALNYTYFRNQISKNSLYFKLWQRNSKNFIEKYELDNQRRRMAGYILGLKSYFLLNNAAFKFDLSYKRGTGMLGSLRAPEEDFDQGTSRMEIFALNAGIETQIGKLPIIYDTNLYARWNKTPLITRDYLLIGGKYSVRGFDGKSNLGGERGYYLRNNLTYQYISNHNLYLALDIGRVSGGDTKYITNRTIAGYGIGFKGSFKQHGDLSYDIFAGFPLYKPDNFHTDNVSFNLNLNYKF